MATKREFDEKYLEAEEKYRSKVIPLHHEERALREGLRKDMSLTPEEKQEKYRQGYQRLNEKFEKLANEFGSEFNSDRLALEEKIHAGIGKAFSEHLASLSGVHDERLPELLSTAQRTRQEDLARAVAQTALSRNQFGVFQQWADSNPELASALKRHRSLPPYERFLDRTLAMRPPKAYAEGLQATAEDEREYFEREREKEAARKRFFNLPEYGSPENPRRQVGRRGAVV